MNEIFARSEPRRFILVVVTITLFFTTSSLTLPALSQPSGLELPFVHQPKILQPQILSQDPILLLTQPSNVIAPFGNNQPILRMEDQLESSDFGPLAAFYSDKLPPDLAANIDRQMMELLLQSIYQNAPQAAPGIYTSIGISPGVGAATPFGPDNGPGSLSIAPAVVIGDEQIGIFNKDMKSVVGFVVHIGDIQNTVFLKPREIRTLSCGECDAKQTIVFNRIGTGTRAELGVEPGLLYRFERNLEGWLLVPSDVLL